MPREDGTEVPCKVEVEYEWVPPKCKNCMSLGHSTSTCPDARKIDKPPVSVYVQKRTVQPPVSRPDVTKGADRKPSVAREDGAGVDANGVAHDEVIDKGKAVCVYNPFDVYCSLMMTQVFLTGVLQAAPCLLLRNEWHLECSRFEQTRPSSGGEGACIRIQPPWFMELMILLVDGGYGKI
ncbi:UNVERIFIED_CONTAM: hypothetical protein Sangu_3177200 [Sesamum angustifolium]|uniref:Uncharacterized protein n=1 Tax=Sesamum angustifolium TaxID=2727405 RepID=A0AAW2JUM4_9LAMI